MENTIPARIQDFLKQYPPFIWLKPEALYALCRTMVVQYKRPGDVVFRQGEQAGGFVFVVREGAVDLWDEWDGRPGALVDTYDEGDIFGIRPLLAADPYAYTAIVREETLLYAVPVAGLMPLFSENAQASFYLATIFAGNSRVRSHTNSPFPQAFQMLDLLEVQKIHTGREPVVCQGAASIREAAVIMSRERVGSIIVINGLGYPEGIITDKDLRIKVATGLVHLDAPVTAIMSAPVLTMPPAPSLADVQIEMLRQDIHHIVLTVDGTRQSPVQGVVTEHDILVLQSDHPAVLVREMKRSQTAGQLREVRNRADQLLRKYLEQEVSISFVSNVLTAINDALTVRILELCEAELQEEGHIAPGLRFCWLALGSSGRKEQLLRTDQDSALVFEDPKSGDFAGAQAYFLALAAKATSHLNACGFELCPANMMASNPRWCTSLSNWKQCFSNWIAEPTPEAVMHSTIFMDYRPLYGDESLATELTNHIFQCLDQQELFMALLARDALKNPPPLTFFRNFVVERSGEHRDEFDIKGRAMLPLADVARVLALYDRIGGISGTVQRFEQLAEREASNRELFRQAADAYETLMRYRTLQGLQHRDSGRYFKPAELSKMERLTLRNCFQPIGELQTLLKARFQLAHFL